MAIVEDLARLIDRRSFERGADYARRAMVIHVDTEPGGEWVESTVRGSGAAVYHVDIELAWSVRGRLASVEGSCTCPVGWNCKHVAAALIDAGPVLLSGQRGRRRPSGMDHVLNSWLARLADVPEDTPDPNAYPERVKDRLAYVLDRPDGAPPVIRVFKTRVLKSGAFSNSATQYDVSNIRARAPAQFVRPVDLLILQALAGDAWSWGSEHAIPAGAPGARVLEDILTTGRIRLGALDGRELKLGAERSARLVWTAVSDRTHLMVAETEDGSKLMPLGLTPPWYVDMETGACGPLTTDLPPNRAALLAMAPQLDSGDLVSVSERIGKIESWAPPRPVPPERIMRDDVRPIPVLLMDTAQTRYGESLPALTPRFEYDGHLASPGTEPVERMLPGRLEVFRRDVEAESAALDLLHALSDGFGFVSVDEATKDTDATPECLLLEDPDHRNTTGTAFSIMQIALAAGFESEALPELEAEGWRIERSQGWPVRLAEGLLAIQGGVEQGKDGFQLTLTADLNGEAVGLGPLITEMVLSLSAELLEAENLETRLLDHVFYPSLPDGRRIAVPGEVAGPLIRAFQELTGLTGSLHAADAKQVRALAEALEGAGHSFVGLDVLQALADALVRLSDPETVPVPTALAADLRPYQRQGLGWLMALAQAGFGGVLADDMGLGKTLQALALLVTRQSSPGGAGRPSLAIVPTSLVGTWVSEATRFAPDLGVLVLHGPDRAERFKDIAKSDLVISTYSLLRRDADLLTAEEWDTVILDEAQAVKNPASQAAKLVRELSAVQRIALTGTPVENQLEELWAIMDWACPGLLGTRTNFRETWRAPIEDEGSQWHANRLAVRIRPFLLRRTKEDVAADLPAKTVIIESVPLAAAQAGLYETIRVAMDTRVREALAVKGLAASQITVLDALLKLRQAACDPALVKTPAAAKVNVSAKRSRLIEMLEPLMAEGRKVLIFSQFVEMLKLIEVDIAKNGWNYTMLTGRTRKRAEAIARFQEGTAQIFLISLKAGGTGLTLTAADTVILYDPWWNPATERQAMDRAHRIGQTKPVFVYRLIAKGTVEAAIQELQQQKQQLADSVLTGDPAKFDIKEDDLLELFRAV